MIWNWAVNAAFFNADLEVSLCVRVHIKKYPENFVFFILRILKLFTRKVCEMSVYKHTESIKYVIN